MLAAATNSILLIAAAFYILNILLPWARNIQRAKASGLPYVVVPYYSYNRLSALLLNRLLLRPCNKYLGPPSPTSWRTLVTHNWPWKHKHKPFALLGTDTFLTVAPGGITLNTADANVTAQIMARPGDFPKASRLYKSLNIYGENVVAAEGATWRYHRKLMSPAFSESNTQLVWKRSLHDGQATLARWMEGTKDAVTTLAQDTMLLSLSVIGHAGFGQSIQWSESERDADVDGESGNVSGGHKMTFTVALTTLLQNLYFIVFLPLWFLKKAPFSSTKWAYLSYIEWGQYMHEIISSKREAISRSVTKTTLKTSAPGLTTNDILTQLLQENEEPHSEGTREPTTVLPTSSILGNLFVMLIAGHETSANSIHFSLALLAMHPHIQKEVQTDLDSILGHRPASEWSYERDLPLLLNSKLNAVVFEQLRLFAPTITIPKCTASPQALRVSEKQVTVPAGTFVRMCLPSLHQNPACWSESSTAEAATLENTSMGLSTFKPSRWFTSSGSWYQPPKGAYIPFSDGARACLGRRFAQVEILAVLAIILSSCSVELAIDDSLLTSGDSETNEANGGEELTHQAQAARLEGAWLKARDQAERTMREKMVVTITLQLAKSACVPVRFVQRGQERFAGVL